MNRLRDFLQFGTLRQPKREHGSVALEWVLMAGFRSRPPVSGSSWRTSFTSRGRSCPRVCRRQLSALYSILTNKYYVDEIYDAILVLPIVVASRRVPVAIHRRRQ